MGMMTRRNVKQRAVDKTASAKTITKEPVGNTTDDLMGLPFVDVPNETPYTKTEINRMSTSDLRELAVAQGIDNADEFTGAELKKMLIDKMGL